jgi:UPF0755 protein
MMRRLLLAAVALAFVAAAAAAGGAWWVNRQLQTPFQGFEGGERFVEIPMGASTAAIGRRLADAGVVRDVWIFRAAVWWSGQARALQAGEYRFEGPATPFEVVARIAEGRVFGRPLTFPEGLTLAEMAEIFEMRGFGPAKAFLTAARNPAPVADLDSAARDLEGYLFPSTYVLSRTDTAEELVSMMVAQFRSVWEQVAKGHDLRGMSVREVLSLASLVEKETAAPAERPMVSAVYRNRLDRRMPLQADPTVVYALSRAGRYNGNIRKVDLDIDSPYNTYRYPGLPPGPIAAPGREAIEAALAPADVPYLYFVSRNNGTHVFAETLTEHNANVQKYQIDYFRQERASRTSPRTRRP